MVDLTRTQVMNLFGVPYSYEQRRDIMLDYARNAGLRPSSGPAAQARPRVAGESVKAVRADSDVPADEVPEQPRILSRAERDELYGLSPFEVERREPKPRPETADDVLRRLIPSYR